MHFPSSIFFDIFHLPLFISLPLFSFRNIFLSSFSVCENGIKISRAKILRTRIELIYWFVVSSSSSFFSISMTRNQWTLRPVSTRPNKFWSGDYFRQKLTIACIFSRLIQLWIHPWQASTNYHLYRFIKELNIKPDIMWHCHVTPPCHYTLWFWITDWY